MEHAPTQLVHLKPGVRLLEVSTGTVWHIERVHRANSYAIPWVHLDSPGAAHRVVDAGSLLSARDGADDWRFAP